ncbi:protein of unknown function [Rhodovastum atsumiense]|nr:protein of unknown function [Rhodovastum atsumiense]
MTRPWFRTDRTDRVGIMIVRQTSPGTHFNQYEYCFYVNKKFQNAILSL